MAKINNSKNKSILILHHPYQVKGGEDKHIESLTRIFKGYNIPFKLFPTEVTQNSLSSSFSSIYSNECNPRFLDVLNSYQPDLVHIHNPYPIFGVAAFRELKRRKIPVVWTIHNHRFYCSNGLALRNSEICKDCLTRKYNPIRPILYNCNRSLFKSVYYSLSIQKMQTEGHFLNTVSHFIAPSPYIKEELIRFGVTAHKISQIYNPITFGNLSENTQGAINSNVFYAGRISNEKGIDRILHLALAFPEMAFKVAGAGPLKSKYMALSPKNVSWLGELTAYEISQNISESAFCILPSRCNEILPTFAIESLILGTPTIIPDMESTTWLESLGASALNLSVLDKNNPSAIRNFFGGVFENKTKLSQDQIHYNRALFSEEKFMNTIINEVYEKLLG